MIRHLPQLVAALLLAMAVAYDAPDDARAASKPLVVVMSAAVPMTEIPLATLRRVFQGEATEYVSGKRFIPINHPPNTPLRWQFDLAVLGLEPDEIGRFWIDRRIRDQPGPPKIVPSVDLAVRVVISLPGAITYIAPELVNPKLRALTIDGKSPGQQGYVLE